MKNSELAIILAIVLVAVGAICGLFYYFWSSPSYQSQCGSYPLIMTSDTFRNGQLFSTWYNCSDSPVTFDVDGFMTWKGVSSVDAGYITRLDIRVSPHSTVDTVSIPVSGYSGEEVTSLSVRADKYFPIRPGPVPLVIISSTYSLKV